MKPILVLCPSRGRSLALRRAYESLQRTSTQADMAAYIDDDDPDDYHELEGIMIHRGPQVGPCKSFNLLVTRFPGYEVYGACTDDSEFVTPHWDEWVLKTARAFPGAIGCLGPLLPGSFRLDYPYVTAGWIEAVGFMAWEGCYHFYWDILVELIGEGAGCIRLARREQFAMLHDNVLTDDICLKTERDARNLMPVIATERPKLIRRLQTAIGAARVRV